MESSGNKSADENLSWTPDAWLSILTISLTLALIATVGNLVALWVGAAFFKESMSELFSWAFPWILLTWVLSGCYSFVTRSRNYPNLPKALAGAIIYFSGYGFVSIIKGML
jgi:hypothetical protein